MNLSLELDLHAPARLFAPVVDAPCSLREAAIATWHGRMINEYASSRVFTALAAQLDAAGFDEEGECRTLERSESSDSIGDECLIFAEEERQHGVLCGAVVEALGGEARGKLFEAPKFPLHEDAPRRAGVLRNVISVCCMSETVAVALIGAERLEMPEGELRALLTRIWADEIGHARFGWRLLERVAPRLDDEERASIARYVPVALEHLEAHELAHLPDRVAPSGGERLGLCSGKDARVLLYETIEEVIVPRLRALRVSGLTVPKARSMTLAGTRGGSG